MLLTVYFPVLADIGQAYRSYRKSGYTRDAAVQKLHMDYRQELADPDDGPVIQIGIGLALCEKNELTPCQLSDSQAAVALLLSEYSQNHALSDRLRELEAYLNAPGRLGDEASYRGRKPYDPKWEIGDTFAHRLTHPSAKRAGIDGWYVLLRKAGEYVDAESHPCQLVYVTLCPPEKLPKTGAELLDLGYLRMMPRENGQWDYWAQISFKGKKDEDFYGLTRIGTFAGIGRPQNQAVENPLTVMPLFGKLKRSDTIPNYESTICLLYRNNGIEKSGG